MTTRLRIACLLLASLATSPLAHPAPLDPTAFTSLGAFPTDMATYRVFTEGATPMLKWTPQGGVEMSITGVVSMGLAVFTFDSITIGNGMTLMGSEFKERPFALLSLQNFTIQGTGLIDLRGGAGVDGFTAIPPLTLPGNIDGGLGGPGGGSGGSGGSPATGGRAGGGGSGPGGGGGGAAGTGPGAPAGGGGGGGFGGAGGAGVAGTPGAGGAAYGDLLQSVQAGSGGGGGGGSMAVMMNPSSGGGGGGGGGGIEIGAVGTINLGGGGVTVRGGKGGDATNGFGGGGGGSGGGIFVHGDTVNLTANLVAFGGPGGTPSQLNLGGGGGGGGGGRVVIVSRVFNGNFDAMVDVAGGTGGGTGELGGMAGAAGQKLLIPEPTTGALLLAAAAFFTARRRRGHARSLPAAAIRVKGFAA